MWWDNEADRKLATGYIVIQRNVDGDYIINGSRIFVAEEYSPVKNFIHLLVMEIDECSAWAVIAQQRAKDMNVSLFVRVPEVSVNVTRVYNEPELKRFIATINKAELETYFQEQHLRITPKMFNVELPNHIYLVLRSKALDGAKFYEVDELKEMVKEFRENNPCFLEEVPSFTDKEFSRAIDLLGLANLVLFTGRVMLNLDFHNLEHERKRIEQLNETVSEAVEEDTG